MVIAMIRRRMYEAPLLVDILTRVYSRPQPPATRLSRRRPFVVRGARYRRARSPRPAKAAWPDMSRVAAAWPIATHHRAPAPTARSGPAGASRDSTFLSGSRSLPAPGPLESPHAIAGLVTENPYQVRSLCRVSVHRSRSGTFFGGSTSPSPYGAGGNHVPPHFAGSDPVVGFRAMWSTEQRRDHSAYNALVSQSLRTSETWPGNWNRNSETL